MGRSAGERKHFFPDQRFCLPTQAFEESRNRYSMNIGVMAIGNADFLLLVMHILGLLNSGVKAKILCMSICKIQKGMEMKKLILKYKGCDD